MWPENLKPVTFDRTLIVLDVNGSKVHERSVLKPFHSLAVTYSSDHFLWKLTEFGAL